MEYAPYIQQPSAECEVFFRSHPPLHFCHSFWVVARTDQVNDVLLEFVAVQDENDCPRQPIKLSQTNPITVKHPPIDPSEEECWEQIKRWNNTCTNEHVDCRRPALSLPTRLLDIGYHCRRRDPIRLLECNTLPEDGRDRRYLGWYYVILQRPSEGCGLISSYIQLSVIVGVWRIQLLRRRQIYRSENVAFPWRVYQGRFVMRSPLPGKPVSGIFALMHSPSCKMIQMTGRRKQNAWQTSTVVPRLQSLL